MTLAELKSRDAAWRKAYDALTDESDKTPGDVTDAHRARFDELYEEAEAIEAGFATLSGAEAREAASTFTFLRQIVENLNLTPGRAVALCRAVSA